MCTYCSSHRDVEWEGCCRCEASRWRSEVGVEVEVEVHTRVYPRTENGSNISLAWTDETPANIVVAICKLRHVPTLPYYCRHILSMERVGAL